jgi:methanogenic corrinoid protein MtbC1
VAGGSPARDADHDDVRRPPNLPVKVVVGGAPVTAEFAEQIGADGYAPDAGAAVDLARGLLNG